MKTTLNVKLLNALIAGLLLWSAAGCTTGAPAQPAAAPDAALAPQASLTQPAAGQGSPTQPAETAASAQVFASTEVPASALPVPIEVTYLTPAQAEGPYYPVQKPDERDSDLTMVASAAAAPAGERLLLQGRVYDGSGQPMPGVLIEIWQTDANGIYLHPGDPNTARRDPNFQFYGEALTAADGSYSFLTIVPGEYEPRPRHIHVKVKLDGRELLTTQFYFPDDLATGADGIFASAGEGANALLVALQLGSDELGELLLGERDVILDLDS